MWFKGKTVSENSIFMQLTQLLDKNNAKYRVMEHPQQGNRKKWQKYVAHSLGKGQRTSMPCKGNGVRQHVLAILPADKQADLNKVATAIGGTRASLASPKGSR